MKKVAISACLMGRECRYDATDNLDNELLDILRDCELVAFCPEDYAFGSPRPTMDLVETDDTTKAISNLTGEDLTTPIDEYAQDFFDTHSDIDLYIGKDRSPSCGVSTAKLYSEDRVLLSSNSIGLMSRVAKDRGIDSWDAQEYRAINSRSK